MTSRPRHQHREAAQEWNAHFYHEVMGQQQLAVAAQLFAYLPKKLEGVIIDAGCGSGVVAAALLRRYADTRLVALDLSAHMLHLAQRELQNFVGRVEICQADLQTYIAPNSATCLFSNAAMHWVRDHDVMFKNLHQTLLPGSIVATQMARHGDYNRAWMAHMQTLYASAPLAGYYYDEKSPTALVTREREAAALKNAGFVDIHIEEHTHHFTFESADAYRLFLSEVILRHHVAALPFESLKDRLVEAALVFSDTHGEPQTQCYESLRCIARRP